MFTRRATFGLLGLATAALASPAFAAVAPVPFKRQAFEAALAAGKPILVHITASWCPTCKAQRPILAKLFAEPAFAGLDVFDVDFDSEKPVVKAFKAHSQSTMIVFKHGEEVGRSEFDTDPATIEALLNKAM